MNIRRILPLLLACLLFGRACAEPETTPVLLPMEWSATPLGSDAPFAASGPYEYNRYGLIHGCEVVYNGDSGPITFEETWDGDRLISMELPDKDVLAFEYGQDGKLTKILRYDENNKNPVEEVRYGLGGEYHFLRQLSSMLTVNECYDASGKLCHEVLTPRATGNVQQSITKYDYIYSDKGNLIARREYIDDVFHEEETYTDDDYDAVGNRTAYWTLSDPKEKISFADDIAYEYDAEGRIIKAASNDLDYSAFFYDDQGRMIGWYDEDFTYEPVLVTETRFSEYPVVDDPLLIFYLNLHRGLEDLYFTFEF